MTQFADKLNQSFRANLCYWSLLRAFGANGNYFTVIIIWIGWIIGIAVVKP
jgi:hypothetical protein